MLGTFGGTVAIDPGRTLHPTKNNDSLCGRTGISFESAQQTTTRCILKVPNVQEPPCRHATSFMERCDPQIFSRFLCQLETFLTAPLRTRKLQHLVPTSATDTQDSRRNELTRYRSPTMRTSEKYETLASSDLASKVNPQVWHRFRSCSIAIE